MFEINKTKITPAGLAIGAPGYLAITAPFGALNGVITGGLGRFALSFFNPAMASAAGTFGTFAAMGAVAIPLVILPMMLARNLLDKSPSLNQHPNVKWFLNDTFALILQLAATTAAAAMLGTPIGPAVICLMIVPAIIYLLSCICNFVNTCLNTDFSEKPESLSLAEGLAI